MKKLLFSTAFLLTIYFSCFSQNITNVVSYPDRYRLYLPNGWNTPKVIKALSYVLPETILELKGKDFCTEGVAGFFVKLIIDSFSWAPHTNPGSYYHFKATLRVYDSTGNPVSQLVLISTEEIFLAGKSEAQKKMQKKLQDPVIVEEMNIYDDSGTRIIGTMPVVSVHNSNMNYIASVPAQFLNNPTNDLLEYSKQSLFKIKKMLKKLSESGQL